MPAEVPSAVSASRSSAGPQERRKRLLLTALLAWALVATGLLAWLVLKPAGPSQSEVWAANAKTLDRLERDFGFIALDTEEFLATSERNWTWNAVNWAFLSYYTVWNAINAPGGFPAGQPLGFNVTAMCVAAYGYNVLDNNAQIIDQPGIHYAAVHQLGLYQNLSERLSGISGWGLGTDPLTAIGMSNITAAHNLMTALWTTNLTDYYGIGPIVAQECGL